MFRLLVLILLTIYICSGARILGIVPTPSYSHQIIFQPIFKELAKRGHDMVVLTTNPQKDATISNFKEIDWSGAYEIWRKYSTNITSTGNPLNLFKSIFKITDEFTVYQLEHPEVVAMIKNQTEHFDLVMVEYVLPIMYAFKHRFNCPMIGMTSFDPVMNTHLAVGNAVHQILYPESMVPFTGDLHFFQRFASFCISHIMSQYERLYAFDKSNERLKAYFGDNYPQLEELIYSLDMLFMNVNSVFNNVRPVTPATITIGGGIHIKDPKPLPKDLQKFLDDAKCGVIYFSLGSNVKSVDISIETRNIILKVFSNLPYKILWKFEADELENMPDNVKIQKWVPQQDVLRHPNIKLFITQGGLQSLEEALLSHVPLVVMAYFGDQDFNAKKVVTKGLGLSVDHKTMTTDDFKTAILEVINNIEYKNRVKELANLVRDEPMNALEKAVWWTEYVLRNKGAQHLKGPGLHLPFYQYYYLDIFAFIIGLFIIVIGLLYLIIKMIFKCCYKLFCKKKVKTQ